MLPAAAGMALCLLLLAAAPSRLARAAWPARAPATALMLWQALGLVVGVLAIEVALTVALAPAGPTHAAAAAALLRGTAGPLPWWSPVAFAVALLLFARLLSVLLGSLVRTLRSRRRHRVLVDLVATRNPLLAGARVVDHEVPTAYCLPGLRPRVVLSRGVLDLLSDQEVRAVLAHETAHVEQRHDLVVLPFVALGATFPRLSGVRVAQQQVALLVEMLADDRAVRRHSPAVLARALYKVGGAQLPVGMGGVGTGGSLAAGAGVLPRAARLVCPPAPLGTVAWASVVLATAVILLLPVLGLVLPDLVRAG